MSQILTRSNNGFHSRLVVALAMFACAGTIVVADNRPRYTLFWKQRTDVGTPGPRYGHALAYDSDRGVTVFFGGEYSEIGGDPEYFNDTWEYDGATWRPITTDGPVPDPRSRHAMCYDNTLRQVILFGGKNDSGYFEDVWNYESTGPQRGRWIQRATALGPGRIAAHTMVFDYFRGRAIVAGGTPDQSVPNHRQTADCWEWDNGLGQWFSRPGGVGYSGGQSLGAGLTDHMMLYDYRRHQALVFGGAGPFGLHIIGNPRIWVLSEDGYSTKLDCGRPVAEGAIVYDGIHDLYFQFGGNDHGYTEDYPANNAIPSYEEAWSPGLQGFPCSYNPDDVTVQFIISLIYTSSETVRPGARAQCAMVYDEKRRVTVLFGGVGGTRYADTWELVTWDSQETWVQFNYSGRQVGTAEFPFRTLAKGSDAVARGGTIKIRAGSTDETLFLTNAMTLQANGGPVTIGRR